MVEALEAKETPCHTLKEYLRNPPRSIIEKTKGWVEAGDPIISAAFDVATGKHMVELSEADLAMKFLGSEGAIREIERSVGSGFLTKEEAGKLTKKLNKTLNEIEKNGLSDVWGIESLLYDLWKIQNFLDKRHYISFIAWFRGGSKLEVPARFEAPKNDG